MTEKKTPKPIKSTYSVRVNRLRATREIKAVKDFLDLAENLAKGIRRKNFSVTDDERIMLNHVYWRLVRKIKCTPHTGRRRKATTETVRKIRAELDKKKNRLIPKNPGVTIEDICQKYNTTYKSFWRNYRKKVEKPGVPLKEQLETVFIIRRLSEISETTEKDRADFAASVELARSVRLTAADSKLKKLSANKRKPVKKTAASQPAVEKKTASITLPEIAKLPAKSSKNKTVEKKSSKKTGMGK